MKLAYLHGLESTNVGEKNDWLQSYANLFAPLIDYKATNIYQTIKKQVIAFQPNVLIGSSMGGFFAYEMAKQVNIPAILFNPALHSRSMMPDMGNYSQGIHKPAICFILGQDDEVINPWTTIQMIEQNGYQKKDYTLLKYGHRTPYEIFKREIISFVEKIDLLKRNDV
jgi:hypothetical protein